MQPEKKQAVFTVTKDHEKVSDDWLLLRLPGNTTPPTISYLSYLLSILSVFWYHIRVPLFTMWGCDIQNETF